MKRIISACLGFEAPDLWLALPASLAPAGAAEILTLLAAADGDSEAVGMLAAVAMLLTVLLCCVQGALYLCGSFSLLLQFSASRRGVVMGVCLHILRMTLLAEVLCAAAVVGLCCINGMFFPVFTLGALWQIISPWVWLGCVVLPVLVGLAFAGIVTRFGRRGGWVLYAVFIVSCFTLEKWLDLFAAQPGMLVVPVAVLVIAAGCGVRWLMRAAVK